ncbi:hypothetical protein ACNOHN_03705 [Bacteroides zhangwenhongii]|uniref:hypothetical protein n=1 Tax=Bacteroides zhangwenhongii TaxID=2650157 RepID=UPI003AAB5F8D
MNTFWKITLGFMIGVVCTLATLIVLGTGYNDNAKHNPIEHKNKVLQFQSDEEASRHNVHSFELSTKSGIIKLHTYMSKDSVQILMGRPQSTDIQDIGGIGVYETWKYKGRNQYVDEFTLRFKDGELESVRQYRE